MWCDGKLGHSCVKWSFWRYQFHQPSLDKCMLLSCQGQTMHTWKSKVWKPKFEINCSHSYFASDIIINKDPAFNIFTCTGADWHLEIAFSSSCDYDTKPPAYSIWFLTELKKTEFNPSVTGQTFSKDCLSTHNPTKIHQHLKRYD